MLGGYVAWEMGSKTDGSDSKAVQIAEREYWPQMRVAILVASDKKKDTSSTTGMQVTVKTSTLFKERIDNVVPKRFEVMRKAILDRDFESFARLTMVDSNQFHAVCLDSDPPIFYMNDVSRAAIRTVEEINRVAGATIAAYTFDAGPNCVVYYLEENEAAVLGPLRAVVDNDKSWAECRAVSANVPVGFDTRWKDVLSLGITRVILSSVGGGPIQLDGVSLINDNGEYAP
jgi:diphosphomevalonate decarboxylase